MDKCKKHQPPGWMCTREDFHFGPCACVQVNEAILSTPQEKGKSIFELHGQKNLVTNAGADLNAAAWKQVPPPSPAEFSWRGHFSAIEAKAHASAVEISLMWGEKPSHLVSRIEVAVQDAMKWMREAEWQATQVAQQERADIIKHTALVHKQRDAAWVALDAVANFAGESGPLHDLLYAHGVHSPDNALCDRRDTLHGQFDDVLKNLGASEDHADMLAALEVMVGDPVLATGMHMALVGAETEHVKISCLKLATLLGGTHYMDQPDGGAPSIWEQLERMAEDAAAYRGLCK